MFDLLKFRKTAESMAEQAKSLSAAIEANKQARERLQDAPLRKADYIKIWHASIDKEAEKYIEQFSHQVAPDRSRFATTPCSPLLSSYGSFHKTDSVNPACLYFIFGKQLKDGIVAALDQVEWPSDDICGPGPAQRAHDLIQLDAKIATLEHELNQIISSSDEIASALNQARATPTGKKARK